MILMLVSVGAIVALLGFVVWTQLPWRAFPGAIVREGQLRGKVCVVTGSNTGIGEATALHLAKGDAHVILACRSTERADAAAERIRSQLPSSSRAVIESMKLDLASRESTRAFVEEYKGRGLPLHILINNAGVVPSSYRVGADELELTWAVNHFNNVLLVRLLLPVMMKSPPARVVLVNSGSHRVGWGLKAVPSKEYFSSEECFSWARTYPETKLATLLYAKEMTRRMAEQGVHPGVTLNAVNPGPVASDIARDAPSYLSWLIDPLMKHTFKPTWKGAEPSVYAAISEDLAGESDVYIDDCARCDPHEMVNDEELSARIWKWTNEINGTSDNIASP